MKKETKTKKLNSGKKRLLLFSCCIIIILAVCLPLLIVGCDSKKVDRLNYYQINAVYDDETKTLACSQKVEYVNKSDNALSDVCFFLYANSFGEGEKTVTKAYFDRAYPNGESYGAIEFSTVKVKNKEVDYKISDHKNILTVPLADVVYPNEVVEITMEYVVSLANIRHRLGYGNNTINFGNFLPLACVYENGFVKNEFVANGDPFYSDTSNFEVEITYPEKYTLASTGEQVKSVTNENKTTTSCKAEKVRDFCFVLCDHFEKESKMVGDVQVTYFYYDDQNYKENLETSAKAVETFNNLFGEYPYKQLSVVKSDFCFGGMEYPNLVLIADDLPDNETFQYVIVHEIAHQWWYGLVGNNEYENAWVDEGLTEYSTALFYENHQEYAVEYETIMENATDTYRNFVRVYSEIYGSVDESMNRNLSEFLTEPEYVNCTYTKGMLMFDSIRRSMSDKKFFNCLKNYFEEYKYKNSSSEKLVESFSKTAHFNLEKFVEAWLEGNVKIN